MENGKGHLFGRVFIDEEAFFDQTAKLKKALPEDLKKADKVARDSDRVISGAHNEAHRLVGDAQSESQRLVGEARAAADRTVQDSRAHSERITEDARREAERIIADAQQHAEQLVAEHVITQRSQEFAEATHRGAVADAEDLHVQADQYALEVLEKTGAILQKLMSGVEQGKNQIHQNRQ